MGIEKFQNNETKEVDQNIYSFEEIRQKVIKLNSEVYKSNTYSVGVILGVPVPYVGFKKEKTNIRGEKDKKHKNFLGSKVGVGFTRMSKKERERFESDKQEMSNLISYLSDLYGLNLPEVNMYVKEENGKVVISYDDFMDEGKSDPIDDSAAVSEDNVDANIMRKPNTQIICDGEKAILKRDGKEEKEFKQRTPEEIKVYKDFDIIYKLLKNEDIKYTDLKGVEHSIFTFEKSIIIQDGQAEYSLIMKDNGDFALSEITNEGEENFTSPLSPEDVEKSLQNIQEKINEGKIINSQNNAQKTTENHDEVQKNEGDLAEEELDKALEKI